MENQEFLLLRRDMGTAKFTFGLQRFERFSTTLEASLLRCQPINGVYEYFKELYLGDCTEFTEEKSHFITKILLLRITLSEVLVQSLSQFSPQVGKG
ncbi:hypothetical protein OUZ56_024942 [Daphnia magna]|uniref:Uncharacterized protein n=1 Tax=Daphnia magna TaxID=35525 RepID=A0ABQ9ZIF5_9CRUS|nr:hypothetical protein OUZ56_024942 [Daphnia magna]